MQFIGSIEISDQDCLYLVDGLARLLRNYEVDRNSNEDINFKRQMMILHKKLERKKQNIIKRKQQ